jgi:hypothetical protein
MSDDQQASSRLPTWSPGAIRRSVLAAAEKLAEYDIPAPPLTFYETLADRAEEIADEAIAEAIDARDDRLVIGSIEIARRLLLGIGDGVFLATEHAGDATLARLATHLLVDGRDGYNAITYCLTWGTHSDPEWGTIWTMHQKVRDFTPAFLFQVCMKGDVRLLAVECHAPTRRLPDDPALRLRARTMNVSDVPVLAFSPAEVEAAPDACASEVCDALSTLAQELLALHGLDRPVRHEHDFRPKGET